MPRTGSKYGGTHPTERAHWAPKVRAGNVHCWRCGHPIVPLSGVKGEGWQLGHRPGQPSHPEHPICNMRAGGRIGGPAGAAITNARRARRSPRAPRVSRTW